MMENKIVNIYKITAYKSPYTEIGANYTGIMFEYENKLIRGYLLDKNHNPTDIFVGALDTNKGMLAVDFEYQNPVAEQIMIDASISPLENLTLNGSYSYFDADENVYPIGFIKMTLTPKKLLDSTIQTESMIFNGLLGVVESSNPTNFQYFNLYGENIDSFVEDINNAYPDSNGSQPLK